MEKFSNFGFTTLNGGINNSTTSVVVTSASNFPAAGNFRIVVDSEIMLVTSVSSNTFTVTRGYESTSAVSHSSGAQVAQVVTSGSIDQLKADINQSDTYANRPAAAKAGQVYWTTNGSTVYRDSGSTWTTFGPLFPLTAPPSAASFSVTVGTPNALVETNGGLYLLHDGASGNAIKAYFMSAPATPYNIEYAMLYNAVSINYVVVGLIWRSSSSGKMIFAGMETDADAGDGLRDVPTIQVTKYDDATTFNAGYNLNHGGQAVSASSFMNGMLFFKVTDNGTNRITAVSADGINYITVHTVGRTDYITADQVGFGINTTQSSYKIGCTLIHWKQT